MHTGGASMSAIEGQLSTAEAKRAKEAPQEHVHAWWCRGPWRARASSIESRRS